MPRVLKDLKISEVSGVDRGAGEGVRVVLMKRHDDQQQEIEMTEAELAKMIADGVTKALPGLIEKSVADLKKASDDALAAANAEIAVLKMSGDEKAFCDKKGMDDAARKTFAAKSPEDRKAMMEKSADADKDPPAIAKMNAEIAKRDTQIADLKKRVDAADEKEAIAKFEKRAVDMGLKAEDGEMVRKAFGGDADAQGKLEKRMTELTKALKTAQDTSGIFKTFGGDGGDTGADAYNQLVAKAAELRKTADGAKLSPEQAFTKVYTDPTNSALAVQHRREEMVRKSAALAA